MGDSDNFTINLDDKTFQSFGDFPFIEGEYSNDEILEVIKENIKEQKKFQYLHVNGLVVLFRLYIYMNMKRFFVQHCGKNKFITDVKNIMNGCYKLLFEQYDINIILEYKLNNVLCLYFYFNKPITKNKFQISSLPTVLTGKDVTPKKSPKDKQTFSSLSPSSTSSSISSESDDVIQHGEPHIVWVEDNYIPADSNTKNFIHNMKFNLCCDEKIIVNGINTYYYNILSEMIDTFNTSIKKSIYQDIILISLNYETDTPKTYKNTKTIINNLEQFIIVIFKSFIKKIYAPSIFQKNKPKMYTCAHKIICSINEEQLLNYTPLHEYYDNSTLAELWEACFKPRVSRTKT